MAATLVPFPAKSDYDCSEVEKIIRNWLDQLMVDHDFSECVTARMMSFINTYATKTFAPTFNLAVPPNISEAATSALLRSIERGVDDTAIEVQEMINKIIIERFLLEVEMYKQTAAPKRPVRLK